VGAGGVERGRGAVRGGAVRLSLLIAVAGPVDVDTGDGDIEVVVAAAAVGFIASVVADVIASAVVVGVRCGRRRGRQHLLRQRLGGHRAGGSCASGEVEVGSSRELGRQPKRWYSLGPPGPDASGRDEYGRKDLGKTLGGKLYVEAFT